MSDKFAFVCTTPFQLMNMVNYICTRNIDRPTLFIRTETDEMKRYADNAPDTGLFSSVNRFEFYGLNQKNPFKKIYHRSNEYFLPKKGIKGCLIDKQADVQGYDVIVTGSPDTFTMMLYAVNPKADIFYIDDGTGSYHGNIGSNLMTGKGRILQKILGRGPEKVNPKKLILYKPELSTNVYHAEIEKLSPIEADNTAGNEALYRIFGAKNGHIEEKFDMIYLAQPAPVNGDKEAYTATMENELKILSEHFGDRVFLRPHPRERDINSFGLNVDTSEYPWELSCLTRIDDNTILIGSFSSALMTPKLLYDTEPYIIFTFRTYEKTLNKKTYEEIIGLIDSFKDTYQNKDKIIMAQSTDEMTTRIRSIR